MVKTRNHSPDRLMSRTDNLHDKLHDNLRFESPQVSRVNCRQSSPQTVKPIIRQVDRCWRHDFINHPYKRIDLPSSSPPQAALLLFSSALYLTAYISSKKTNKTKTGSVMIFNSSPRLTDCKVSLDLSWHLKGI